LGVPCAADVRDREGAAVLGNFRLHEVDLTVEPPAQRLASDGAAPAALEQPAEPGQVRGERFGRGAVALRMLERVRVHHQAVDAEVGRVAEVAGQELVHERLTARRPARDGKTAPCARLDDGSGVRIRHGGHAVSSRPSSADGTAAYFRYFLKKATV